MPVQAGPLMVGGDANHVSDRKSGHDNLVIGSEQSDINYAGLGAQKDTRSRLRLPACPEEFSVPKRVRTPRILDEDTDCADISPPRRPGAGKSRGRDMRQRQLILGLAQTLSSRPTTAMSSLCLNGF